jgi:hypothetical protein
MNKTPHKPVRSRPTCPPARNQRSDAVQLAVPLWWDAGVGHQTATILGEGEPEAEEAAGRSPPGHGCAEGYRLGKVLRPAVRRRAVDHVRRAHGLSQRRACGLIGMDVSSYRYQSRRPDDGPLRERLRALAAIKNAAIGNRDHHVTVARHSQEKLPLQHKRRKHGERNELHLSNFTMAMRLDQPPGASSTNVVCGSCIGRRPVSRMTVATHMVFDPDIMVASAMNSATERRGGDKRGASNRWLKFVTLRSSAHHGPSFHHQHRTLTKPPIKNQRQWRAKLCAACR